MPSLYEKRNLHQHCISDYRSKSAIAVDRIKFAIVYENSVFEEVIKGLRV
jgi:hypothetical protein